MPRTKTKDIKRKRKPLTLACPATVPISKKGMCMTGAMVISAVHQATENIEKPPKFLMDKLKGMENSLNVLNTSLVKLKQEHDALKIEVLKHLDYTGGINMKILELLTLQNNNFVKEWNRVSAPTARRITPFVIEGMPILQNTARQV